jgi:hypothetical protein
MTTSQKYAMSAPVTRRSMKTPKFQSAIADTNAAKARLRLWPGLRSSEMVTRQAFRTRAARGRR